jgi:hypothetical protein
LALNIPFYLLISWTFLASIPKIHFFLNFCPQTSFTPETFR